MIRDIGKITGRDEKALDIIVGVKTNFAKLKLPGIKHKTCYLIWRNPYMTVGGDTFINSLMELSGFENIYKEQKRYPVIRIEELRIRNPEFVLLSSEPFPFKQKHIDELQPRLPSTKLILVDGEMFSWYGSRMLYASKYFNDLLFNYK